MDPHRGARMALAITGAIGTFGLFPGVVTHAPSAAVALVTAQPQHQEVSAGRPMTVNFAANPPYRIVSCAVESNPSSACTLTTPQPSATATVELPAETAPGPLTLAWTATLYDTVKELTLNTPQRGEFTVVVRPPEPRFAVTANRESGPPGAPVTVSFTALDRVTIRSCQARFAGQPDVPCGTESGARSAVVPVPSGASPGATTLEWTLVYTPAFRARLGSAAGTIPFRVSPRPTGPMSPPSSPPDGPAFSVFADEDAAAPGQAIHVRFRPLSPSVRIVECEAGLGVRTPGGCTAGSRDRSVELRLDPDEAAGSLPIHWTLSYSVDGDPSRQVSGVLPLTVLAVSSPWSPRADGENWFTVLGGPVAVLAAAGLAALALRTRKPAPRRPSNEDERRGPAVDVRTRVGAPRVSVHDLGSRPTRTVRVNVRVPAAVSTMNDPTDTPRTPT